MQLQRPALRLRVAHPAEIALESTLRPLDGGFPIDEFNDKKSVLFREAPFAGHLKVGEGGVEGLETRGRGERME